MIVWADTETTGLDEKNGHLLEVALVMTDDDLVEGQSISVVVDPCTGIHMDDVVREMHTKNGLLTEVLSESSLPIEQAEALLCEWFKARCASPGTLPLAGSTIGFDRKWLRAFMPKLEAMFSYRSIDVSSITEIASRWAKPVYDSRPKGAKAHRALDDARESIAYLRYYREAGFIGPTPHQMKG